MPSCRQPHALLPSSPTISSILRSRPFSAEHYNEDIVSDHLSYASLVRHCGSARNLQQGKLLHALINRSGHSQNIFLSNLLIQMYGKCGAVHAALDAFDSLSEKNLYSWAVTIDAFNQNQAYGRSVQLFHQMRAECVIPDNISLLGIVTAQSVCGHVCEGKRLHACAVAAGLMTDVVLSTGLISMYARLRSPYDSLMVFDNMHNRSVVTWNAMISVYASLHSMKALQLFQQMQLECSLPGRNSFVTALSAVGEQGNVAEGCWIHAKIVGAGLISDVVIAGALINLYGRCGSSEVASVVFNSLTSPNLICWTAMMVAYSKCGRIKEALQLLLQMDVEGMVADDITYISIVDGCATSASIMDGKRIHMRIVSIAMETIVVANALIIMYGKCGITGFSLLTFLRMQEKNVTSWNSIITAFALNGDGKMVLELYRQMQAAGILPNRITFSSLLSACGRAGLVDEGFNLFCEMGTDYEIVPMAEHYNCLIDFMGRSGRANEAEDLMNKLPVEPTVLERISLPFYARHLDIEQTYLLQT